MLLANWVVLIMLFMPWICAGIGKKAGGFTAKDNHNSRVFFARAEGVAARANAAQQNTFEILPAFVFVILLAQFSDKASIATINFWAVIFLLSRICYVWAYLADKPTIRSLIWILGLIPILALFIAAI